MKKSDTEDNNEFEALTPVPDQYSSFNPEPLIDGLQRIVFIGLAGWHFLQTGDVFGSMVLIAAGFIDRRLAWVIMTRFLKSSRPHEDSEEQRKSPSSQVYDDDKSLRVHQNSHVNSDEKLFVDLASKKALSFQPERSVARKLTSLSLKPLDRENCKSYFDQLGSSIEPEIRDLIFEWTRGYPLAMHVMAQAVSNGLDPRTEQGEKDSLSLLTNQVINQEVFARIKPGERAYYQSALQLFSVPRHFNLVIMQDLIEKFAPELKRESSLAYFSLPKSINEATDVLNWSMVRAGFSVDEPIRTIFLLLLKIEQPKRYFDIHDFLAQTNLDLAKKVLGSDRMRYIRECLYHIASNSGSARFSELLAEAMQIILGEPPGTFQQFSEEFSLDEELKEALGDHLATIQPMISAHLAKINTDTLEG